MDSKDEFVCRCCFYTGLESDFKDMLTEIIATNSNLTISEYFVSFSGISLEKDDSTRICPSCETKLKSAFEFREFIISKNIKVETIVYRIAVNEDPDADVYDTRFTEVSLSDNPSPEKIKPIKTSKKRRKPKTVSTDEEEFSDTVNDEIEEIDVDDDISVTVFNKLTQDIESVYHCFVCDEIVRSYRLLKTHQKMKHSYVSNNRVCGLCLEKTDKGYMNHIIENHPDYKPHSCDFCSKKFQQASELCNHLHTHIEGKKFKCVGCGEAYKTVKQLRTHIISAKHTDRYSCPGCGKGFEQIRSFVTHFNEDHTEIKTKFYPCDTCYRIFMLKKFYEEHICSSLESKKRKKAERNEKKPPFKCDQCPDREYSDEEQLLCHQIAFHENFQEKLICELCNKNFSFKYLLDKHLAAAHQKNSVQCDHCGKCFPNKQRLRVHKIVHSNVRDIKCPSCPSLFKDRRYLKQHVALIHSGQKNFKCNVCERLFGTMGHLKCHMGTHFADLRKFECELCQKKFVRVVDRDRHIQRTHRDERPHKCDMCPKAYYAGNHLREHQRSAHTDVRFECKYCGNRYARSKSLVEHIFSHLGYKPFNCPATECVQGFVKKETFKKHLSKSHNIQFDEALHGFKASFQDILKLGLQEANGESKQMEEETV